MYISLVNVIIVLLPHSPLRPAPPCTLQRPGSTVVKLVLNVGNIMSKMYMKEEAMPKDAYFDDNMEVLPAREWRTNHFVSFCAYRPELGFLHANIACVLY